MPSHNDFKLARRVLALERERKTFRPPQPNKVFTDDQYICAICGGNHISHLCNATTEEKYKALSNGRLCALCGEHRVKATHTVTTCFKRKDVTPCSKPLCSALNSIHGENLCITHEVIEEAGYVAIDTAADMELGTHHQEGQQ